MSNPFNSSGAVDRRDQFFAKTRTILASVVNGDGVGKLPQFNPPFREPVWILPALYTGPADMVALANRMVARYNDAPARSRPGEKGVFSGKEFNIFQSNAFAAALHRFDSLLTPAAREVMVWHTEQVFEPVRGSAQPDFKFHGANDNMPMLATKGLILGGEALHHSRAVEHGFWNLNQCRRLLSRNAWMSEFNSSTYSAVTLTAVAKIATFSRHAEIRELAAQIEHRIWAEILLHFHPGTFLQAGPQTRAYAVDSAGHTHALQLVLWMAFGPEASGRDPIRSCFTPDPLEVMHFQGNPYQSIAEYCDMLDTDLHVPPSLAHLITQRAYPAEQRGRSECLGSIGNACAAPHTTTYMERAFSLGTSNMPWSPGDQHLSLYVTYQRKTKPADFRDAAAIFPRYVNSNVEHGAFEKSEDGGFESEKFLPNRGSMFAMQKKNVGLLLCYPDLRAAANGPLSTEALKLALLFPAHYGRIRRSIIGNKAVADGAVGRSKEVVPVSVEAGEVLVHIQPLLPTNLPRRAAVRFVSQNHYEVLELVNYEGAARSFERLELSRILNGFVLTVQERNDATTLEQFHRKMSDALVTDYGTVGRRFVAFDRPDVHFEVTMTTDPFGVETEAIDGRTVSRPLYESNQIDVNALPFMTGEVARNKPLFPWPTTYVPIWSLYWMVGSRGIPGEANYSRRDEGVEKE